MAPRAKPLFDKLLSIEVDLVVVDQLAATTVEAAPADPDTVTRTLAATYRDYLDVHIPDIDTRWRSWVASGEPAAIAKRAPGRLGVLAANGTVLTGFEPDTSPDELRRAGRDAAIGEAMIRALLAAGRMSDTGVAHVLRRIRGNVDQLRSDPALRVTIARKALELGTETIKAQTVVQIDGDAVQRMDTSMLGATALCDLHTRAVAGAVGHWQVLIELLVQLVVGTVGLLRSALAGRAGLRRWSTTRRKVVALSGRRGRELWSLAAAKQTWQTFGEAMRALLTHGGATIATPAAGQPYARTVIQPDGDSVWLVASDMAQRHDKLELHAQAVSQWYADTSGAVATVQRYVSAAQAAFAAVLATASAIYGLLTGNWTRVVIGLVITLVLAPSARWLAGRLLRRRIHHALAI